MKLNQTHQKYISKSIKEFLFSNQTLIYQSNQSIQHRLISNKTKNRVIQSEWYK